MSAPTKTGPPREEVERRLADYRRIGFQRQAPAHVVYHEENQACPWAGCGLRIAGINFCLDSLGDAAHQLEWLRAWWNGPGLLGRCPGCQKLVLFALDGKRAVIDPAPGGTAVLPDDWHEKAHLVMKST